MPNVSQKQKQGFTLLELLITIALIGILSSIIAMTMVNPQKNARDAKRKSDLELIRSGLEIYSSDCGSYPATSSFIPGTASPLPLSGTTGTCSGNTYITTVPVDQTSGRNYSYVLTTATTYALCAALEMAPSPAMDVTGCGSCGATCNYKVTNP